MRVLAVWLTMVASEPSLPTRQGEAAKSAPVATAAAGAEVEGLIVIAPRRAEEPDWSKRLNLDVRGDFGSVDTPYLRRRPTNGCKVMAGGARSPSGASGAAGGLVCAKAF